MHRGDSGDIRAELDSGRLKIEPFENMADLVAAILTIALSSFVVPLLPYLLGFAAGAMVYVVVEELIPQMSEGEHSNIGVLLFAVGFTLMMALDVALG